MKDQNEEGYRPDESEDDVTRRLLEDADAITRELDEIRDRSRGAMRFSVSQSKKLGSAYILLSLAESDGLRDDLYESFGKYGDWMLAEAVSMILAQDDVTGIPDLESNMSRELLGIIDSMDPSMAVQLMRDIGRMEGSMETLFSKRLARSEGVLVADTPYIGEFGDMEADDDENGYWISCNESGIPVHFISGTMRELREYGFDRYQNEITKLGAKERTFILEKRTGNADLYERLIERGSRFISVSKSRTSCTLKVAEKIGTKSTMHKVDGIPYAVYSSRVSIVTRRVRNLPSDPEENDDTDTLDIVTDGDPRFHESPPKYRFTMWAFRPLNHKNIDPARMERKISVIERRLRSLDPKEAMEQFEETAGSLAKFFHISLVDGKLDLEVKRRELDLYLEQRPSVFFSYGFDTWENVVEAFGSRQGFDRALSALRGQLRTKVSIDDPDVDKGRVCIRFIALIMWCILGREMDEAGMDEDVGTLLDRLNSVRAVGDGLSWRVVGQTPRNRSTMTALGLKHPRNSITTMPYDYYAMRKRRRTLDGDPSSTSDRDP